MFSHFAVRPFLFARTLRTPPHRRCGSWPTLAFATDLRKSSGTRFSGDFVREQFRKNGIAYQVSEKNKSQLYGELLPLINSRVCDLLDHPRVHAQLTSLERRTSAGGRDTVTHPPNAHDDLANACAGALVLAHAVRGDGKTKVPKIPLPVFDHRPSYGERGVAWMAGPRRWN
jgi:hypothetical protein